MTDFMVQMIFCYISSMTICSRMWHKIPFVLKASIGCLCAEFEVPMNRADMQSITDAFVSHELCIVGNTTIQSRRCEIPADRARNLHTWHSSHFRCSIVDLRDIYICRSAYNQGLECTLDTGVPPHLQQYLYQFLVILHSRTFFNIMFICCRELPHKIIICN